MGFALYKAALMWKERAGYKGFELLNILIRDQAIYFLVFVPFNGSFLQEILLLLMQCRIIVVCIANIKTATTDPVGPGIVFYIFASPASLSILSARLLFNMREEVEKGLYQGTSCPTDSTMSEINFGVTRSAVSREEVGAVFSEAEIAVANV